MSAENIVFIPVINQSVSSCNEGSKQCCHHLGVKYQVNGKVISCQYLGYKGKSRMQTPLDLARSEVHFPNLGVCMRSSVEGGPRFYCPYVTLIEPENIPELED